MKPKRKLRRGPLPLQEALTLARQMAEAIQEAYEKGIIHRDLKPGNVKITPNGQGTLLDFGLAKIGFPSPDLRPASNPLERVRTFKHDPLWDDVTAYPRYAALLKKHGLDK